MSSILAGDDHVTGQCQPGPAGQRRTGHCGDDRLGKLQHVFQQIAKHRGVLVPLRVGIFELARG